MKLKTNGGVASLSLRLRESERGLAHPDDEYAAAAAEKGVADDDDER